MCSALAAWIIPVRRTTATRGGEEMTPVACGDGVGDGEAAGEAAAGVGEIGAVADAARARTRARIATTHPTALPALACPT